MIPAPPFERLPVCSLPALDLSQVAAGAFAEIATLLAHAPAVRSRTQPRIDQLATILDYKELAGY